MNKKLDYKSAIRTLQNKSRYFVYWSPFDGEIRNSEGETFGRVSTRIADKLSNSELLIHTGNGTGLLSHEKYYRLRAHLPEEVVSNSYCIRRHDLSALTYPKVAENLTKEQAEKIKDELQSKSIDESGCIVPIFFVSEV